MSADDTDQSPHVMASAFFSNSFAFWSPGDQNVWVTPDLLQKKSISPGCNTWVHPPDNIQVNFVCTHPTVFNSSCLINLQLLWRICFKVPEKLWDPRHYNCLSRSLYAGDVPVLKRTLPTGYYLQKNYLSFLDVAYWAAPAQNMHYRVRSPMKLHVVTKNSFLKERLVSGLSAKALRKAHMVGGPLNSLFFTTWPLQGCWFSFITSEGWWDSWKL